VKFTLLKKGLSLRQALVGCDVIGMWRCRLAQKRVMLTRPATMFLQAIVVCFGRVVHDLPIIGIVDVVLAFIQIHIQSDGAHCPGSCTVPTNTIDSINSHREGTPISPWRGAPCIIRRLARKGSRPIQAVPISLVRGRHIFCSCHFILAKIHLWELPI
jgi:hypothetical protein